MANKVVQFRRGTTLQHQTFAGAEGEITVDTDKHTIVVHDGETIGGFPLKVEAVEYIRHRYLTFRAGIVQQGIPSLGFSAPENSPFAVADVSHTTGVITGFARFSHLEAQSIQDHFMIPTEMVAPIDLSILWRVDPLSTQLGTVGWTVETANLPMGDSLEYDFEWFPQQTFTQVSNAVDGSIQTCSGTLGGTYLPGSELFFRITRDIGDSDTIQAPVDMLSLRFTLRIKGK